VTCVDVPVAVELKGEYEIEMIQRSTFNVTRCLHAPKLLLKIQYCVQKRCHQVAFISYQLSKAFDSAVHGKLCRKLSSCGFSGKLFYWIHAFLHTRTFGVRLGSCLLEICNVISGVPQGSLLGSFVYKWFWSGGEVL